MQLNEPDPYRVQEAEDRFAILGEADRVIITTRDEGSARSLAVMLCEAFRRGHKAGYREARKAVKT